jgi:hypothetical protein
MLSLSGLIFVILMAVYSMKLNTKKLRANIASKKHLKMFLGWFIGINIPISIVFQSSILGYIVYAIFTGWMYLQFRKLFKKVYTR